MTGERWYRQRRWRWPLVVGFALVLAAILIGVTALTRVLLFHESVGGLDSYISPLIIGLGSAFAAGVAQPWGERRRARRAQSRD